MTDELFELGQEITAYICELHDLTNVIKDMDATIVKESTPDNMMLMQECIDRYKSSVTKLKVLLEAYFSEEAKSKEVMNFSFRRLYKQLQKAL